MLLPLAVVTLFVLLPLAIVNQAWVLQSAALRQDWVVHTSVAPNRGGFFWATQLEHCDSLIYPLQVGWKHIRTMSFLANSATVAVFHALGKTQLYTRLTARRSITLSPSPSYESTKLRHAEPVAEGDGRGVR